jgi:hypothetical protein
MRRLIWRAVGWVGFALCEAAFRADCRGPFGWLYRAGCAAYGAECDLGVRWGFLAKNPRFGQTDEPFYVEAESIAGRRA